MKGTTAKSGWRDGAPHLSFATMPPRSRETLSTPPLSPPEAESPQCQSNGVPCIDIGSPVGIGWQESAHI